MASAKQFAELEIVVVDIDRHPVDGARIRAAGGQPVPKGPGRYVISGVPLGRSAVEVEADEYPVDRRSIDVVPGRNRVDVILASDAFPSYQRRGGRVPFRSPDDQLGVVVADEKARNTFVRWATQRGFEVAWHYGPRLAILTDRNPSGDPAETAAEVRRQRGVKQVGRLVNPGPEGTGLLTNRLVVQTVPKTEEDEVRRTAETMNCTVERKLAVGDRWVVIVPDEGLAVLTVAAQLAELEVVVSAEPDLAFTMELDAINPTDQLFADQWHLPRVGTPGAWQHLRDANAIGVAPGDPTDRTFGDAGIIIGVMDTGVESVTDAGGNVTPAHPEFQGTVTSGADKVVTFFDFGAMVANNDDPMATFGDGNHGTMCAGVAAARANNASVVAGEDEGGAGAAPNCRILAAQGDNPMLETDFADMYLWLAGFDAGNPDPAFPAQLAQGADVITNSWGGYNPATWPLSALITDTFDQLADDGRNGRGTLMFFSTGNGSSANFWTRRPYAAHARTFGIGAVTDGDVRAGYSNWGDGIDLCAPSSGGTEGITTTTLVGTGALAGHTGGAMDYTGGFGGTSSATPLAAGVAALLLSMDPTLTEPEARAILTRTAERVDAANADPDGRWRDDDGDGIDEYSWWYGFGMVDAARAACVAHNTISVDPSVSFVDVPEGEPALMPVTIRVKGWRPRTFVVSAGPTTTTGPAGSFVLHAGSSVAYTGSFECDETHIHLWLRYTGTTDGDVAFGEITLHCPETAESFDVSLSANTLARVKTALVMSLDRSGSMDDPAGDGRLKIELVRDSAAVVPILVDDGTGLGAVRWDTDADLAGAMPVEDAGPEVGGPGRSNLATFVQNHATNPWGMTAIGDAVEAAQSVLDGSVGYDSHAMIVLTDGNETESKYLSELTPDQLHSRIYAIGVGTPQNIQPASLALLAGQQDGYLLMTGTIDSDDTFLLTKYFQQILAGITNTEIVVDPQGFLAPGVTLRLPFPVNETDREVDVILHSRFPWLVDFLVEAPDGQIFGPGLATGPGAQYVVGRGTAFYRLALPSHVVGPQDPTRPWYARLHLDRKKWQEYRRSLKEQPAVVQREFAHGVRYAFTTQARSSLRMDVTATQSSREPGATAWLRAALTEYGYPLTAPAGVVATITRPDGAEFDLTMSAAGGGVFEASFIAAASGAWRVTFRAKGETSRGAPFAREAIRTVAVWPGGDRPGPSTPPKDTLGQLLRCLCKEDVLDRGILRERGLNVEALCKCVHGGK